MKRSSMRAIALTVIALIVVVLLAGIVVSNERSPTGQAPPITENTTAETEVVTQSQSQLGSESSTYAVTARDSDAIDTTQLAKYGEVGTRVDERIELTMSSSNVSTVQNISWVRNVRPVIRPEPAQTEIPGSSDGVGTNDSLGVQQAHQSGITGEDVDVGVIDAGFDPDNQAIASNVVDTRSFRSSTPSRQGRAHGTSTAEVLIRTAPDTQLSLVSTGTATDIEAAIDYLKRQDVDIIVHSQGVTNIDDDGDHRFTDNINAATESGTLFVNAAGNEAQKHWEGEFRDTDGDDNHEWTAGGRERNCLPNCDTEYSGSIRVSVRWNDQGQESHYRPALLNPVTNKYIAIGGERVLQTQSGTKYTRLNVQDLQSQRIVLVVNHVSGPADDEIEVTVPSGPQEIEQNIPASSIAAPADVPKALAVAAYQVGPRQLAPYSSRGPTDDGRTGIDVTAYTNIKVTNGFYDTGVFAGTSAAAPYAGGVAALIEANQPGDQSPTELTNTLTASSDDILDSGTDPASGSGVINTVDALNEGGSIQVDIDPGDLPGDGSESDPYKISNASELQAVEDDLNANYELVSDIDASQTAQFDDGAGFDPIGSENTPFSGSFDGNNHTITELTINRADEDDVGLFGVSVGTLTEITLTNATVTGNEDVGRLVGTVSGDSRLQGVIASGEVSGDKDVGGVAGVASGSSTLRDVTASGNVNSTQDQNVGGLVGGTFDNSTIRNATASGNVIGGPFNTGGLIGDNNGNVISVTATTDVSGVEDVGGLVGDNNGGTIRDAKATGNVNGSGSVGGLVGDNEGTVISAEATGDITGIEDVGGLSGDNEETGVIDSVTASGEVTGTDFAAGGLVGANNGGTIQNATATGDVTGESNVGGVAGLNEGTIIESTGAGNVTGVEDVGGLVGDNDGKETDDGIISRSTASGEVAGGDKVGGLVGSNFAGEINLSVATGSVVVQSPQTTVPRAGGLVGGNFRGGVVNQSYAKSAVSGGGSGARIGGLVGENFNTTGSNPSRIFNSYASGSVSGSDRVGGLVGGNFRESRVVDSYWDTQATGQSTSDGSATGLTTTEMQGTAAIENMNLTFGETWQTVSGDYPELIALADLDADSDEGSQSDPESAQFEITLTETSEAEAVPVGEQLRVTTQITNTGSQQTEATIQLTTTAGTATGTDTDTQSLTLASGDSTTQTLTVDTTGVQPGTYTATVSVGITAAPSGSGGDGQTETVNSTSTEFAVSPLEGAPGEFDTDGDGEIGITEVSAAAADFIDGDLSIGDISQIAAEFIN